MAKITGYFGHKMDILMYRAFQATLNNWKNTPNRAPLLVRGARQVGKTYCIQAFAQQAFKQFISINFEYQPEFKTCFETFDPKTILDQITILTNQTILPEETLLFLDEIQECPKAIQAMRYFKEKLPQLAVIGAGSLLELTLKREQFRMPVGRLQYAYLKPMSFYEFLLGSKQEKLHAYLKSMVLSTPHHEAIHNKLLDAVRLYSIIGGMPAVVHCYATTHDLNQCQQLQAGLLNTYRNDFGKYGNNHNLLTLLFNKVVHLIGNQIKYTNLVPETRSRTIKPALSNLIDANLMTQIYASKANGLPLNGSINEKKFKLLFFRSWVSDSTDAIRTYLTYESKFITDKPWCTCGAMGWARITLPTVNRYAP